MKQKQETNRREKKAERSVAIGARGGYKKAIFREWFCADTFFLSSALNRAKELIYAPNAPSKMPLLLPHQKLTELHIFHKNMLATLYAIL